MDTVKGRFIELGDVCIKYTRNIYKALFPRVPKKKRGDGINNRRGQLGARQVTFHVTL